jgi:integrase
MTRHMLNLGGMRVAPGHPIIAEMERAASLCIATAYRYLERERLSRSVKNIDLGDVGAVDVAQKPTAPPSIRLSELYKRWKATLRVADKEIGRLDHQQRRLVETIGDLPINHITKAMISEHMALVARFPGRKRSVQLSTLPMHELVEQFERENMERKGEEKHQPLTAFTAAEWFSGYQRMFKFAVVNDLLEKSPVDGLKEYVVRGSESTTRRAFTLAEIDKLFGTPLFRGYDPTAPKGSRNKAGSVVTRDAKYWLPVIALLHGARLTEMAAMPLSDIRKAERGGWHFDLTDRNVKTATSRRVIPMHPRLIELGFLEHLNGLCEAGETWLFPDLDHKAKVGPGHGFSKWFGRWMGQIGLTDKETTFHSFRHTWVRRARETPNVKKEMHDIISGHKGMTVSDRYGRGADISPLARDMAKIVFPELTIQKVT